MPYDPNPANIRVTPTILATFTKIFHRQWTGWLPHAAFCYGHSNPDGGISNTIFNLVVTHSMCGCAWVAIASIYVSDYGTSKHPNSTLPG
jgi:hypothetical protein